MLSALLNEKYNKGGFLFGEFGEELDVQRDSAESRALLLEHTGSKLRRQQRHDVEKFSWIGRCKLSFSFLGRSSSLLVYLGTFRRTACFPEPLSRALDWRLPMIPLLVIFDPCGCLLDWLCTQNLLNIQNR